jgi:hypothetical protein
MRTMTKAKLTRVAYLVVFAIFFAATMLGDVVFANINLGGVMEYSGLPDGNFDPGLNRFGTTMTLYNDPNRELPEGKAIGYYSSLLGTTKNSEAAKIEKDFLDSLKGLPDKKKIEKIDEFIHRQIKYGNNIALARDKFYTVGGTGNCMVFSSEFQYLCDRVGVPCLILMGEKPPDPVGHQWNAVYFDGKWWGYDGTGDKGYLNSSLNSGNTINGVYIPQNPDAFKIYQELMVPGSTIGMTAQPDKYEILTYTDEASLVEVPNLVGLTEAAAVATIENLGLRINIVSREDYSVENGCVYAAYVDGPLGEWHKKDGKTYADPSQNTISLYVAKNNNSGTSNTLEQTQAQPQTPTEQTQPPNTAPVLTLEEQGYVAVPNVVGLSEAEAVATFKTLGFTVQIVNTADSQNLSGYVSGIKIDGKTEISNGKTYAKPDECIIRIAIPLPK